MEAKTDFRIDKFPSVETTKFTGQMRFADGALQQEVRVAELDQKGNVLLYREEWIDVPHVKHFKSRF